MFFPFPTSGRLGQMIKVAVLASAALSGDLERLKDIFESDDCSIFIQRPGVEEANLPGVLEHWTLREYVELAFLRAATGSSRRRNLRSMLLWMDGLSPLFTFRTVGIPHHPRVSSWPLRALLEARVL